MEEEKIKLRHGMKRTPEVEKVGGINVDRFLFSLFPAAIIHT